MTVNGASADEKMDMLLTSLASEELYLTSRKRDRWTERSRDCIKDKNLNGPPGRMVTSILGAKAILYVVHPLDY